MVFFSAPLPPSNQVDSRSPSHQEGARNKTSKASNSSGKPGWHQDPGWEWTCKYAWRKQESKTGRSEKGVTTNYAQPKSIHWTENPADGESWEILPPCLDSMWVHNQLTLSHLPLQFLPHLGEHNRELQMNKKGYETWLSLFMISSWSYL